MRTFAVRRSDLVARDSMRPLDHLPPPERCSAIPASSRRWGARVGADEGCASTTTDFIVYGGHRQPICKMHATMWHGACSKGERAAQDLAALWKWPGTLLDDDEARSRR